MIRFRWKNKWIPFEKVEWSGTDTQCSRKITVTLLHNPYDSTVEDLKIKLGDLVYLYDGTTQLFVGTVTTEGKNGGDWDSNLYSEGFHAHLLRIQSHKKV